MIRRLVPAVMLVLFTAGINFLFVPFCFSKEISNSLAIPQITKPITNLNVAVSGMCRFEIYHGGSLLRKGHSIEYVNAIMEHRKLLAIGAVRFINYKAGSNESVATFVFDNIPAEQFNVLFFDNTGEYEIRRAQVASNKEAVDAARPVSAADHIFKMERLMTEHVLSQKRLLEELNNTIIIMKKGLAENITGQRGGVLSAVLSKSYQVMKQDLRRLFIDRDNIMEVETATDMFRAANAVLSEKLRKVILIDDGTMTGLMSPEAVRAQVAQGEAGVNYCMIIADVAQNQTGPVIPFVNMKAIAMMGLAILSNDPSDCILFEMAYKSFTGRSSVPQMQWLIKAPPRTIPVDIERPDEQRRLNRLFGEAA